MIDRFPISFVHVVIVLLFMQAPRPAYAFFGYCSEPSEPSCLSMLGLSPDEFAFDLCRSEVEAYIQSVKRYTECLIDEVQTETEEQNRKVNNAIERFNCYASGNDFCP